MDWTDAVTALAGHSYVLAFVVGCLALKRLPGLIAAFRVAFAQRGRAGAQSARSHRTQLALDLAEARLEPPVQAHAGAG